MGQTERQDDLFREAIARYGAALDRLVRAYEADPDKRRDLSQEVQLAVWCSLERFEARCSLRTWIYRVAHNTASNYIVRQRYPDGNIWNKQAPFWIILGLWGFLYFIMRRRIRHDFRREFAMLETLEREYSPFPQNDK